MPRYSYTAKISPLKVIQGTIEAESEQDAVNKLGRMGYFPTIIEPEVRLAAKYQFFSFRKVSNKDIVILTRQLSTLLDSGVNIMNALDIASSQTGNEYLKAVLLDVAASIKDGKSLSDSLKNHPQLFSNIYSSMIKAGEISGNLHITLKDLADFLEKEEDFRSSVRAALTYPVFVLAVGALTIAVLLGFVIPRLVVMFEDMGQALPLPTRILISISSAFHHYWWLILSGLAISVFFLKRMFLSPQGRILRDKIKTRLFVIGPLILKAEVGHLMRALSLLSSGGVNIIVSLDTAASLINNQILKQEVQKFKERISEGSSLSKCLKEAKFFEPFAVNIIRVGEEAGNLGKSFLRIADDYEKEVDRSLKVLTRLLEPVIILIIGLIVGFIVLAMLLPIFEINFMAR
jgi:type II secretory pathway component PulF